VLPIDVATIARVLAEAANTGLLMVGGGSGSAMMIFDFVPL